MDGPWCKSVLQEALLHGSPETFNTDQGSQFTSPDFVKELTSRDIKVSMDGQGRALDNVFVKRLWRTVKYENIYLKSYENMVELKQGLVSRLTIECTNTHNDIKRSSGKSAATLMI